MNYWFWTIVEALNLTWLAARVQAVVHMLRGHDVKWRVKDDGCPGDIICESCPDVHTSEGLIVWCRYLDPWRRPKGEL